MVPAVRDPSGGCVDESSGCTAEQMTLCAFSQCGAGNLTAATNDCSVTFLKCMDDTTFTTAPIVGKTCAEAQGLDFDAMDSCYSGDEGATLLKEASDLFNQYYPGSAYIPAVTINFDPLSLVSEDSVKDATCAAGSTADVC
jgi:hypothetical protein